MKPGKPILTGLSLRFDPEDRIALLGKNGNGKSTLAKLLAGKLEAMGGEFVRARKLVVGYFAQHQQEELDLSLTPIETLSALAPQTDPGTSARPAGRLRLFRRQGAHQGGTTCRAASGRG